MTTGTILPPKLAATIDALDRARAVHERNLQEVLDARADAEIDVARDGHTLADVAQLDREADALRRAVEANKLARTRAFELDQGAHRDAIRAARLAAWTEYERLTGEQIKAADQLDRAFAKLDAALIEFLKVTDERETHLVQAMRGVVGFDRQANARSFMGRRVVEILLRSSELAAPANKRLYSNMVHLMDMSPRNATRASEQVAADAERIDSWIGQTVREAIA